MDTQTDEALPAVISTQSMDAAPPTTMTPTVTVNAPPKPHQQMKRKLMTQPSTVAVRRQQAVCVRRAHKMYGTKKNPNIVLDGLSMTVPKGTM